MGTPLRLGVLGYARIAQKSMIDNFVNSDRFILSKIASRSYDKLKLARNKFDVEGVIGYDEVVDDPNIDCVYIPLPTGLHFEWARKCIISGKHVMVEKSICSNLKDAQELINLSYKNNVCLFENFMFEYNDQYKIIRRILTENLIGDLRLFKSSFGFPIFDPETNIRYNRNLGGGALLDAGAYVLRGSQFLLGAEQNVISSKILFNKEYNVDFHGYVTLQSENGVISQLSYGFDNYYQNQIEIWGSKGTIKVNRAYTSPENFEHRVVLELQNNIENFDIVSSNPGVSICKKFAKNIESGDLSENDKILKQASLLNSVSINNPIS